MDEETVKNKIDSAEVILKECFDMLLEFKQGEGNFGAILYDFQPKLADCLYDLMSFYKMLQNEKQQLIATKNHYDKKEFSELMSRNASFSKTVSKTIELGKNLGDAFAWFFFCDNRTELDKHFDHEPTGLFVSGIGGLGELKFIKNNKFIDGLFVLYHGITTMLRIGDFSLYDTRLGIVGVGELKTMRNGDRLNIVANITSKIKVCIDGAKHISNNSFEYNFQRMQKDFPRLRNQLSMHTELMKPDESAKSDEIYGEYEYRLLDQLQQNNSMAINSDKSLLFLAQYSRFDDIFSIFSHKENIIKPPDNFFENAQNLITNCNDLDSFIIGHIANQVNRLSIPILWWNISNKLCHDIYFGKVSIITVFNPAKLLMCYVNDGFTVSMGCEFENIKITKEFQNNEISIGNFESICYLITNGLMKTNVVYESARLITKAIEAGEFEPNTSISMQIHLNNFGKH